MPEAGLAILLQDPEFTISWPGEKCQLAKKRKIQQVRFNPTLFVVVCCDLLHIKIVLRQFRIASICRGPKLRCKRGSSGPTPSLVPQCCKSPQYSLWFLDESLATRYRHWQIWNISFWGCLAWDKSLHHLVFSADPSCMEGPAHEEIVISEEQHLSDISATAIRTFLCSPAVCV